MYHRAIVLPEEFFNAADIRQIALNTLKAGLLTEDSQTGGFQPFVVKGAKIVEADYFMSGTEKPLAYMKTDETGTAGNEYFAHPKFSPLTLAALRKSFR